MSLKDHLIAAYIETYAYSGYDRVLDILNETHAQQEMVRSFFGIPNRYNAYNKGKLGRWLAIYDTLKMPFKFLMNIPRLLTEVLPLFLVKVADKKYEEIIAEQGTSNQDPSKQDIVFRPKVALALTFLKAAQSLRFIGGALTYPVDNLRFCARDLNLALKGGSKLRMVWAVSKFLISIGITSVVYTSLFPLTIKLIGVAAVLKVGEAIVALPYVGKAFQAIGSALSAVGSALIFNTGSKLMNLALGLGSLLSISFPFIAAFKKIFQKKPTLMQIVVDEPQKKKALESDSSLSLLRGPLSPRLGEAPNSISGIVKEGLKRRHSSSSVESKKLSLNSGETLIKRRHSSSSVVGSGLSPKFGEAPNSFSEIVKEGQLPQSYNSLSDNSSFSGIVKEGQPPQSYNSPIQRRNSLSGMDRVSSNINTIFAHAHVEINWFDSEGYFSRYSSGYSSEND